MTTEERLPTVAILGRPNVGKSTLFNRILGERRAVTSETAGTTRDRIYGRATWNGRDFLLVDTGGLVSDPKTQIEAGIREQVLAAIGEADVFLLLVDGRDEPLPEDLEVARLLRPVSARTLVVANKVDRETDESTGFLATRLGLPGPAMISAMHGRGVGDFLDELEKILPERRPFEEDGGIRVAVIGRPNVGKSSIVNALLGRPQVLVADEPGTTRDAIDTRLVQNGEPYTLIDTAGLRRRTKVDDDIEYHSTLRTLKSLDACNVALVVLDGTRPPENQDLHVGGMAESSGRGIVLLVNKWDIAPRDAAALRTAYRDRMPFLRWAPLRFVSAKTGEGIDEILPLASKVVAEARKRIPTRNLLEGMRELWTKHPPPGISNSGLFATQPRTEPPTFVIFLRNPEAVPRTYLRYLENGLRDLYGFKGAPIRIHLRKKREKKREVSRDHWAS